MPVRRVVARPEVAADRGRFAVQHGPLVYCAEGLDNVPVRETLFPGQTEFDTAWQQDLLGGIVRIAMQGGEHGAEEVLLRLVPDYAWTNRSAAEMLVWFPTSEEARY